ncbi:MAG: response regulator transcription factor [Beijerinckiaceae bacterium]
MTIARGPAERAPAPDAPHLLVVDDDARIRSLLARFLGQEGYRVTAAASAAEARARLAGLAFDLIVLDVMMPGENGFQFATGLRRSASSSAGAPILMLTARGGADDRILGLEAGVDDYLAKPFEPRELSLRIAAILRRAAAPARAAPVATVVRFAGCEFHPGRGEMRRDGEIVRLTDRERDILRALAAANGAPVSRAELGQGAAGERTVDVQVTRLRRKIEKDPANPIALQTVRGAGYRLLLDEAGGA